MDLGPASLGQVVRANHLSQRRVFEHIFVFLRKTVQQQRQQQQRQQQQQLHHLDCLKHCLGSTRRYHTYLVSYYINAYFGLRVSFFI